MSAVTPATREVARRLLRHEAGRAEPLAVTEALDRVFDRLRQRLVALVGPAGFAALATRSLHLARLMHPVLSAIAYDTDATHCLRGTRDFAAARTPEDAAAALTDILAQLLGLLDTFIGAALTMRLLGELWPDAGPGVTDGMDTEGDR